MGISLTSFIHANIKIVNAAGDVLRDFYLQIPGKSRWENKSMLLCEKILEKMNGQIPGNCIGACFATSGPINSARGLLLESANFDDAIRMPVRKYFKEMLKLPCEIANITHAAAVLEYYRGSAKSKQDFLQFSSTCEGASGYLNGILFTGMQGSGGEVGSMFQNTNGILSNENTFAGQTGIHLQSTRLRKRFGDDTSFEQAYDGTFFSMEEAFVHACERGDQESILAVRKHYEMFSGLLINILYLLNPETILLPWYCQRLPEITLDVVKRRLAECPKTQYGMPSKLLPASFNERGLALGAALLMSEKFLTRSHFPSFGASSLP